jgi:Lhr-like helicase
MRTSDHLSEQLVVPVLNTVRHVVVDETIARFLTTSAYYLKLSAERLEQIKKQKLKASN